MVGPVKVLCFVVFSMLIHPRPSPTTFLKWICRSAWVFLGFSKMLMLGALGNPLLCSIRLSDTPKANPYQFLDMDLQKCWGFPRVSRMQMLGGLEILCFLAFSLLINPSRPLRFSSRLVLLKHSFSQGFPNRTWWGLWKVLCFVVFSFLIHPRPTPTTFLKWLCRNAGVFLGFSKFKCWELWEIFVL